MSTELTTIQNEIYAVRDTFASVLTDRSLNFEKEAGFALQSISASDYAMGIALRNRQSVINAVTNIAAIGISLNPAKKQAYLVPRDGKICLDISYMGLMDLAIQSGSISWGQAELVYSQDSFELRGFDKPPVHGRNPFSRDRGDIVGRMWLSRLLAATTSRPACRLTRFTTFATAPAHGRHGLIRRRNARGSLTKAK